MKSPSFIRTRRPSTPLERGFFRLFRLSSLGSAVTITCFVSYLLIGGSLHIAGYYAPPFSVMSLSDPFFTILGSFVGGFTCVLSGSLTLLTLLADVKEANAEFVILMSMVAFGCGAATMQITSEPVYECLSTLGGRRVNQLRIVNY